MPTDELPTVSGVLFDDSARTAAERRSTPRPGALALATFQHHPHGLVVVDRDGRSLAHNPAALRILARVADEADDAPQHMVDEVLRRIDKEIGDDGPVLLRALAEHRPPLEVRIDLPATAELHSVWVMVARLDGTGEVLLELRPGWPGDRRRRTAPHRARGPHLRIRTLGRTQLESCHAAVAGPWLEHRTGRLLKYLVAERHRPVHIDEIVEHLWPDSGERGVQTVRYFIHRLREHLEPGRAPWSESSFIRYADGAYCIDPAHVEVDADEHEAAVKSGLAALELGERAAARAELERAMELYTGDFLAEEPYAEWAMAERTRLRSLAADALEALAGMAEEDGDLTAGALHLRRHAELDPFDVDVHRRLIALCLRRGRRTEALYRYTSLRERLMSTFGEELDFTLGELSQR